jgi:ketosteroid isomerase-like protein
MPGPPKSPEACDLLFFEHVNAGDLDALLSLYEPTCRMVKRDGSVAQGHAEIREVLGRVIAIRARMTGEIVKVVAGDEVAMVYNDWQPDGTWRFILDDPYARG